jgi:hypothetical protein
MRAAPVLCALLLAATPALAQSNAPSNIGLTQYPAPKCDVPPAVDPSMKPQAPDADRNTSQTDALLYNARVRTYNNAMRAHNDGVKAYATCVQGYIAAGKADIERIQAAVDAAVATANGR